MKKKMGSKAKLREYFIDHVGEILDSSVLHDIAGASEWGRRVRELRNEEGMNIQTHNDRSDLSPGKYILLDLKPLPAFAGTISKETRALILDRNGYTCQMCGAAAGEPHPHEPNRNTRLHIAHIIDKTAGGTDDPSNLFAVCSVCNEGASNITLNRPNIIKLLSQIRRSPKDDQIEILRWLVNKYKSETLKILELE